MFVRRDGIRRFDGDPRVFHRVLAEHSGVVRDTEIVTDDEDGCEWAEELDFVGLEGWCMVGLE